MTTYTYEEALKASEKYFGNDLSAKAFVDKYALRNEQDELIEHIPTDMFKRIASELFRIEKSKFSNPYTYEQIYDYIKDFAKIIPQGSPLYGIGNLYQIVSTSNCFVIESPIDSYGGICKSDQELVQISKRRGGVGLDLSNLRPENAATKNAAKTTSGISSWMERYSNSIREVGQFGRRGALMLTLSVHHPDILTFITIKNDDKKVTGANISVRLTNEFLNALYNNADYELRWPEKNPIIKKNISAKLVWDTIIRSAWLRAEPGLLFWNNITKESVAGCYDDYKDISCNPCAELILSAYDSCRLLAINLFHAVDNPFTKEAKFNFVRLRETAIFAQRMMDNIVDLELEAIEKIINKIKSDPEPDDIKQVELNLWNNIYLACKNGRRTGTGITALGDTIASLNVEYGSEKSIKLVGDIYKTIKLACYRSSVDMSKELGPFPVWDHNKEKDNPYLNRIKDEDIELYNDMKMFGRRNIALLTTAPTGTISMMASMKIGDTRKHGTTSGVEPLFTTDTYIRRKKGNPGDNNFRSDFIDQSGDHWMEFEVCHPGIELWKQTQTIENNPYVSADKINWTNRVKLQAIAQKHVDHAISSCVVGDTMCQTDIGLLSFEELCGKTEIGKFQNSTVVMQSNNINNELATISQVYNNGIQPTIKVLLEDGRSIRGTYNHKICILDKKYNLIWKRLDEIKKEDCVVGRMGLRLYPKDTQHKSLEYLNNSKFSYKKVTNSKNIQLPTKLTPELSRLLGYLCSDGCVGKNGISLCQLQNNVCEDFTNIIENLFGTTITKSIDTRSSKSLMNLVVNSREIKEFFTWLGIYNHYKISVPRVIRMGTYSCIKEFIKGCTLDGHVGKNGICVMTSVCRNFLEQLQLLLLNIGIKSRIYLSNSAGFTTINNKLSPTINAYMLCITHSREVEKFISKIGFAEERKQKECEFKYEKSSKIKLSGEIPNYGLRKYFRENILKNIKSNKLYNHFHSLSMKSKDKFKLTKESIIEMIDIGLEVPYYLIDDTYIYSEIKDIQIMEESLTYDISVPNGNSYVANGIVSHNTINLPNNATEEDVAKIYLKAWECGLKGITVYRDGCRSGVLINKEEDKIFHTEAPKRPKELDCDVYHITVKGQPYFVLVGIYKGEPYEVFAGKNGVVDKKVKTGKIIKLARSKYKAVFDDESELSPIGAFTSDEEDTVTRLISTGLRHGASIAFIVHQLEKAKGDLSSFAKSIVKALKKYIEDGTEIRGEECPECQGKLRRQEGCVSCSTCGYSKC